MPQISDMRSNIAPTSDYMVDFGCAEGTWRKQERRKKK